MKRALRPRPAVTAAPVTFTDLTSFDIVGLVADQMRKTVRKYGIRHMVEGQRMIVRVDDWLAFLDRNASTDAAQPIAVADDEPQSEAEVLARLGFRKCGS